MEHRNLQVRPDLTQLRQQAKDLLRAFAHQEIYPAELRCRAYVDTQVRRSRARPCCISA